MLDYSQPDFYHFSEDSTQLARYVVSEFEGCSEKKMALDICAGCGVVGIEINRMCQNIQFDFCEVQEVFLSHLEINLNNFASTWGMIIFDDFQNLGKKKYDLIVCNPPYFNVEEGRLPEDEKRAICRFFIQGNMESLVLKIRETLSTNGVGYIVTPQIIEGAHMVKKFGEVTLFKVYSLVYKSK